MLSWFAKLAASMILASGLALAGTVSAQTSSSARKAAEEVLRAGLAAQKARRHVQAVGLFTQAINAGGLARKQMTYALYRRAISNRAHKRPAQAISDLNSALFFKGDLSSRDRAGAIEERMKAFKDAGIAPTTVATASSGSQWSPLATPAAAPRVAKPRVISSVPPSGGRTCAQR